MSNKKLHILLFAFFANPRPLKIGKPLFSVPKLPTAKFRRIKYMMRDVHMLLDQSKVKFYTDTVV